MLEKKEEKEERKEWVEPELIKCEEPLDEVTTMPMNGPEYQGGM